MPMRLMPARLSQLLPLYLPAALMALLALGTWWLVRSTPVAVSATPPTQAPRQQDYEMQGFATTVYAPSGAVAQNLSGEHLAHFSNNEVEVSQVRMLRQEDAAGAARLTRAQAQRAVGRDDGSDMTLSEQVHLQQAQSGRDALDVQAQQVRIYDQGERMLGQGGVHIRRGALALQGQTMNWDRSSGVLTMQGRVHTTLAR